MEHKMSRTVESVKSQFFHHFNFVMRKKLNEKTKNISIIVIAQIIYYFTFQTNYFVEKQRLHGGTGDIFKLIEILCTTGNEEKEGNFCKIHFFLFFNHEENLTIFCFIICVINWSEKKSNRTEFKMENLKTWNLIFLLFWQLLD